MTRRMRVYVAGPISTGGGDYFDLCANLRAAFKMGDYLFAAGYAPMVPQLTHFTDLMTARTHSEWMENSHAWVLAADAVLRMPGASKGADMEVAWAHKAGIPVVYSVVELVPLTRKTSLGLEKLLSDWSRPRVSSTKRKRCVPGRKSTARTTGARRK
jgi:hypothetical protein